MNVTILYLHMILNSINNKLIIRLFIGAQYPEITTVVPKIQTTFKCKKKRDTAVYLYKLEKKNEDVNLCILFDSKLLYGHHIQYVEPQAYKTLGFVLRMVHLTQLDGFVLRMGCELKNVFYFVLYDSNIKIRIRICGPISIYQ